MHFCAMLQKQDTDLLSVVCEMICPSEASKTSFEHVSQPSSRGILVTPDTPGMRKAV